MKTHIVDLEQAIANLPTSSDRDNDYHDARRCLLNAIRAECQNSTFQHGLSLPKHLEIAAHDEKGRRVSAILVLRCLGIRNLLPENTPQNSIDRRILDLCKTALPDLDKEIGFSNKRQTYEAIELLRGIYPETLRGLGDIKISYESLEAYRQSSEQLIKCLRQKQTAILLQPYEAVKFVGVLTSTVSAVKRLINTSSNEPIYVEHLEELSKVWVEERQATDFIPSFLWDECIKPFSESFRILLSSVTEASRESFKCSIKSRLPAGGYAEKRYPIREAGREFSIAIPMANEGPGLARNVRAKIISNSEELILNDDEVAFGDVRPGQISFSTMVMIAESVGSAKLTVQVSWEDVSGESTYEEFFDVLINAQNPDINWNGLATLQPYKRVAAKGDEFVGRADKLSPLCAGFSGPSIQSAYIWGQKRVGKTSLAFAVRDFLEEGEFDFTPVVHIFEWGDVAANTPEDSVMNIGEEISSFLDEHAITPFHLGKRDFEGGLRPLAKQGRALYKKSPDKRYIIIFDEFDEIHSEMYRFGPLAEAFFSNI